MRGINRDHGSAWSWCVGSVRAHVLPLDGFDVVGILRVGCGNLPVV